MTNLFLLVLFHPPSNNGRQLLRPTYSQYMLECDQLVFRDLEDP